MQSWHPDRFLQKYSNLKRRSAIIKGIRTFFEGDGFLEVDTPVLQVCPGMETHIHGFKTELHDAGFNSLGRKYLHSSPEFAMKRILAAGQGINLDKIYQMCPVFRNGEVTKLHSPEFTMLEWYRTGVDYTAIMQDCTQILRAVANAAEVKVFQHKDMICDPFKDWRKLSVVEAFKEYADIDLDKILEDTDGFNAELQRQNIRTSETDNWDDLFFRVIAEKIEPYLGQGIPCILYDYPISMASLSRPKQSDPRYADRFELYVCGVELANAFTELTDTAEQRQRFVKSMKARADIYGADKAYPIDEGFLIALEHGLPDCAGIALGVDRLVMLSCNAETINDVLWEDIV